MALQIAYLPTLYGAYNRRETLVTLLESRAGSPAWGPELLIRHQLVGAVDNLASLFAEWERWAADVAESHTSYPSLLFLRSPRAQNSWLVSLIAVMDAAALSVAVNPEDSPIEARMLIRMGFTCLRHIAEVARIPFDADPGADDPIALPREEFARRLRPTPASIDYPMARTADEAWPQFRGWRVNYESVAYALADRRRRPAGPVDRAPEHVRGPGPRTGPSGRPAARTRHRRLAAGRLTGGHLAPDRRRLSGGSTSASTGCSRSQPSSLKAAGSSTRFRPTVGSSPIHRAARTRSTWEWATQATSPDRPGPGRSPGRPGGPRPRPTRPRARRRRRAPTPAASRRIWAVVIPS